MGGFSKLGVNLGIRSQKLPPQLTKRFKDDSESDSSSEDSEAVASDTEDVAQSLSAASEADIDEFESDSDVPLPSSAKLPRRRSYGDTMRGPRPFKRSTGEREPTISDVPKKMSGLSTPARSFKDSNASSMERRADSSSAAASLKESQEDIKIIPSTPSKHPSSRKLEERFSVLRQSPTLAPLSPTKISRLGGELERPLLSRHASSQKFTSKPVPMARIATEEGPGPSIMFIDTPSPPSRHRHLPSAYRPQDPSCGAATTNPSSAARTSSPSSSRSTSSSYMHRGSAYSTQSLPLSFNDLPCRAQHLILNELMRQNSKDTAVMFTTLPSPVQGTHTDEEACLAYLSDLDVLGRGCPPCLMVHSNSMTVTMSL